ncbi:DUF5916 domain-containing protein [uncultured Draconibacterium sp.]|uniref:DUF5916 domain-containing protein n=1 Tax=uncultured Draconibacterium sp. TaxID=1573823 RepID=UPI003216F41B
MNRRTIVIIKQIIKTSISLLALLFLTFSLFAQDYGRAIRVNYITEPIKLDGILDEAAWQQADKEGDFWQFFPTDTARAKYPTEFMLVYNDHFLYIGVRGEASSEKYVVSSLRRDFRGTTSDNVSLMFDTFKDGNTAFLFGMTPYGVQREAFISQGGAAAGFNANWDQKWQLESKINDGYFILEAAIPFSSIKFREGDTEWRMQCYRWDIGANEQSAWAHVPQNQLLSSLAFMNTMEFEKPLGKSRTPFSVIPYINALASKDFELGTTDSKLKFGGDAKIPIGNSMNLDITINPDFSNTEVDAIFTNLTRFEVFLPEKRQFFIDNSDLFGSFGSSRDANPFFSRRIGLARNNAGNTIENRIVGGVRLSGKLNEDWRLGFLNVQTDEDIDNGIASNNNMMLAVQKKMFARSNIGFFAINRQAFKDYDFLDSSKVYNRVVGLDYNLASANDKWTGKFFLHKSFQPNDSKGNLASQAYLVFNTRKWRLSSDFVYVNEDFTSDLGFIPRRDIFKIGNSVTRTFYPSNGIINSNAFRLLSLRWLRPSLDLKQTDYENTFSWTALFKNSAEMELSLVNNYIYLFNDFDPTRTPGAVPLPGNRSYTFNQFQGTYQSNLANLFTYNFETTLGEFYNGSIYSVGGEVAYRVQPWATFSVAFNYDGIRLPDSHADADIWLLSPKADITFSKSLFWSTLVQYSNQRSNLGINSRLQWRFAPLSDLHLVYNDNYITDNFRPRFRSINLKLTYWLNI